MQLPEVQEFYSLEIDPSLTPISHFDFFILARLLIYLTGCRKVGAEITADYLFGVVLLVKDGKLLASNFNQYPLLRNSDAPDIDVLVINSRTTPSGMGEPPIGPVPATVANAVFSATGQRLRRLH